MLRKGFFALASLALAACATEPTDGSATTSNDCFRSGDAHGFTMVDDHHIRVHVGASRNYILGTTWNARMFSGNPGPWNTTGFTGLC